MRSDGSISSTGDHVARVLPPLAAGASSLMGAPLHTSLAIVLVSLLGGARYAREWSDALLHIRNTWWPSGARETPHEPGASSTPTIGLGTPGD